MLPIQTASLTLKAKYGVHTEVGNYEIFTTSVEAMDEAQGSPNRSLVDNPKFQASIKAIPRPNQGYMYLDWTASQIRANCPFSSCWKLPENRFLATCDH